MAATSWGLRGATMTTSSRPSFQALVGCGASGKRSGSQRGEQLADVGDHDGDGVDLEVRPSAVMWNGAAPR
jgi:hypothetical protein